MQSSANKTFLPEVVELITSIFIFSHRLKIKSLVRLYKHSQSPYSQAESTCLSITIATYETNLTIPRRQQLNALFSAWTNHLTFYPCQYFKDFLFILTRFRIFPLVYFLMSSKWMPEAYAPQTRFHFLLIANLTTSTNPEKSAECASSRTRQMPTKNQRCSIPLRVWILSPTMTCSILIHTTTIHFLML